MSDELDSDFFEEVNGFEKERETRAADEEQEEGHFWQKILKPREVPRSQNVKNCVVGNC